MGRPKGTKCPNSHGRPKGVPNKITASIREMIELALHNVGGADYIAKLAEKDPRAFCTLIAKIIPNTTVLTNDKDAPAFRIVFEKSDENDKPEK